MKENALPDWKRLWQLVSGVVKETPKESVLEELKNVSIELCAGLQQFQPVNKSGTTLENLLKKKKQEKLLPILQHLQELLGLESEQCWRILCFYLKNEYRGSASTLTTLISTESNMAKLLEDILGYYTLERMVALKVVKNLLIFYNVQSHPYQKQYKEIVDQITFENFRESYLKQFEMLINENPPFNLATGDFFDYHKMLVLWSGRNLREINEILHILLMLCEHKPMEEDHITKLFSCFKMHAFGKEQCYSNSARQQHSELITKITHSEIVLFLKMIEINDSALGLRIIKALEDDISKMYHCPEDGPLLFAWMLLNLKVYGVDNIENANRCCGMGKRAVALNCFGYMQDMLKSQMFKNDGFLSRIAQNTIYNLLDSMCDYFDKDGSCANHPFIYDLLCQLLSDHTLACQFSKQDYNGVRSLWHTLLELFPLKFIPMADIATALTNSGLGDYIKSVLENLPIFTELFVSGKYNLKAITEDEGVLQNFVQPLPKIDGFVIPSGTRVQLMTRQQGLCIHFRTKVNFFNVLHQEILCLLAETTYCDFSKNQRVLRVNAGLKYLEAVIRRTRTLSEITPEMVQPTEMVIIILNKFRNILNPPVALLATCLNVCTALLPLTDEEIYLRLTKLDILPILMNHKYDFEIYAQGFLFDSKLIGKYLVDVEKKSESYDFLLAYLGFLRKYIKLQRNHLFHIEIPGLVFLLREVFPNMHAWHFKFLEQKNRLYIEILSFICDIFDFDTIGAQKVTEEKKEMELLRNICLYSLLNMENGIVLLRFVAIGNAYLQHSMETESNWMEQQPNGLILQVRLAIRILMQLLRLKTVVYQNPLKKSPLETLIYTQPKQRDAFRIMPVVTSYMNNIFDRLLPILSCRLLKRIALEFNMSLLCCLDMEHDQIRMTFLQRLLDDLESDSLKIAILELVEACIEKQPGMTEAFFKVDDVDMKPRYGIFARAAEKQIAHSIISYMDDYLEAISKNPLIVQHAISNKMMNIFHSLWSQNKQNLIEKLKEKPNFWSQLCSPLFSELRPQVTAYTQLLNILASEIYYSPNKMETELKNIIEKFFEPKSFDKWLEQLLYVRQDDIDLKSTIDSDMPNCLCRLQAFKGFLLVIIKTKSNFLGIPQNQLKILAEKCLNNLIECAKSMKDLRPFIILSEIYLLIVLNCKFEYADKTKEDKKMLAQFVDLLNHVGSYYEDLHMRAKEAVLSLTIKCTDLLVDELLKDTGTSLKILNSIIKIVCSELETLEEYCIVVFQQNELDALFYKNGQALNLSLNLIKTYASIFQCNSPQNWDLIFINNKVLQRLLSCARGVLQIRSKQKISIELLEVFIVFAKGNYSAEFLNCSVEDYLWLKLCPPKNLIATDSIINNLDNLNNSVWTIEMWWPIYARGIELVDVLLEKENYQFLNEALLFVGIHNEFLIDSLLLSKQSLEPSAMKLIKSTVSLLCNLSKYNQQWRLANRESLMSLMNAVQLLLGHCISLFHQPRNLKFLIKVRRSEMENLQDTDSPETFCLFIAALNELTEIIILCIKCLLHFSPDLQQLICAPEIFINQWQPILEVHFGAPKLSENAIKLTFGTMLSIVSVYTKAINLQNYNFHEKPLNSLPKRNTSYTTEQAAIEAQETTVEISSNRSFSKSVSVASASSTNCPSIELLANLDRELCLMALEHILLLAASQSMLALKNTQLPPREKQLIRREISSELMTFHELVKKKVLVDHRDQRDMWLRRKHGSLSMYDHVNDDGPSTSTASAGTPPPQRTSVDVKNSMRVKLTRRLHLQQLERKGTPPVEMIRKSITDSNRYATKTTEMELETEEEPEKTIQLLPPEEATFSPLSFVKLVEEDFLHFMSNLFYVICQND